MVFEKIKQNQQTLSKIKEEKKTQINKIINEREDITADATEIKKLLETIMNNYIPINWTTEKKCINS